MSMSASRFEAIHKGQSAIARKVYDAVPIAEAWDMAAVMRELHRCSASIDLRIVSGCLNSLARTGLVREVSPGQWQRTAVREPKVRPVLHAVAPAPSTEVREEHPMPSASSTTVTPIKTKGTPSPGERVSALAGRLRNLAADASALATELEEVGLSMEMESEENAIALQKLSQLRGLLKEL